MEYLWVGFGGFLGANARFVVNRLVAERLGTAFPYGTLLINVVGSLLIGVILTLLSERLVADPLWRLLIVIGFLGGFTTFSSYTFEVLTLAEQASWRDSLIYVLGNNLLGLVCCYVGIVIARLTMR